MIVQPDRRRVFIIVGVVVALVAILATVAWVGVSRSGTTTGAAGPAQPVVTPAALTPEQQAAADLEQLVRDYEATENKVFLDPELHAVTELSPYLRSPVLDDRAAQINRTRDKGHVIDARDVEVHSIAVTSLDLAADPPAATVAECRTVTATGTDGQTGEPINLDDRRLVTWSAAVVEDGQWRLYGFTAQDAGSC